MDAHGWIIVAMAASTLITLVAVLRRRRADSRLHAQLHQLTTDFVNIANTELQENRAGRQELKNHFDRASANQTLRVDGMTEQIGEMVTLTRLDIQRLSGVVEQGLEQLKFTRDAAASPPDFSAVVPSIVEAISTQHMEAVQAYEQSASRMTDIASGLDRSQVEAEQRILTKMEDQALLWEQGMDGLGKRLVAIESRLLQSAQSSPEQNPAQPGRQDSTPCQPSATGPAGDAFGRARLAALLSARLPSPEFQLDARLAADSPHTIAAVIHLCGATQSTSAMRLPVHAVFPYSDQEAIVAARKTGDTFAIAEATNALSHCLEEAAGWLQYYTRAADPAIQISVLFLPTEALYAEAMQIPELQAKLCHRYGVVIVGPSTLIPLLKKMGHP